MRAIWVAALLSTGCAALFQDRLKGEYDGRSEPQCSTSSGWAIVDGALVALSIAAVALSADDQSLTEEQRGEIMLSGLLNGVVHGASAAMGLSWAGDCREAYADWNRSPPGIEQSDERDDPKKAEAFWCGRGNRCTTEESTCPGSCTPIERAWCMPTSRGFLCAGDRGSCITLADKSDTRNTGECVQRVAARWAGVPAEKPATDPVVADAPKPAPPPPLRGYFCTSSPTAGLCAREKPDCETARDAAIGALPDLAACTLVETAHCFDADGRERCFPTAEQCAARASGVACAERK